LHFLKELSYGYLRFEGNGKIPSNLRLGKCNGWYYEKWVGRSTMPLFLLDDLLRNNEKGK
jgi:hypothetical protein